MRSEVRRSGLPSGRHRRTSLGSQAPLALHRRIAVPPGLGADRAPAHSVIYRRRPDVGAVFHSHPRYGIMLGLLEIGFVAFTRESGLFADGVPVFPSSKGINNVEMAERLADTLGDHYAVFLKGHGVVVVGPNVEATAVAAIQFENACYNQLFMMQFTKPEPLGDMSHGLSGARMENPYRAWPFLLLKHGLRPKEEIRAMAIAGSRETLREAAE